MLAYRRRTLRAVLAAASRCSRLERDVLEHATEIVSWRAVADFRTILPANSLYETVYAHGTTQNHPPTAGLYRFQFAAAFDTRAHPDGSYRLDVEVGDSRGNSARGHLTVQLANAEV